MVRERAVRTEPIRILIADDHTLMREGLQTILETQPDLRVVGLAATGAEAVAQVQALHPDLVLMDVRMPEMDGVEAARRISEIAPQVQVLMLSAFDDDVYVIEALKAGAVGYLLKDFPSEELIKAIRTVHHSQGILIPPAIAARVLGDLAKGGPRPEQASVAEMARSGVTTEGARLAEPLTPREEDILRLVARGRSNQEIAQALYLAEGTVKNYISRIYAKLPARDRAQAVLFAIERGLTEPSG
ncbi:MAG: response regulator transcription factor [bacterium]|nr:response regulator transcription factor [bacterium]